MDEAPSDVLGASSLGDVSGGEAHYDMIPVLPASSGCL